jgi:hypothetical protein
METTTQEQDMTTTNYTPLTDLNVGDRITLIDEVDRFPHFIASKGAKGTVEFTEADTICISMDDHIDGCEEWDNEIVWIVGESLDCEVVLRINDR